MLATGDAIILEATLGFFGLGAQPPVPSWGAMMSAARRWSSRRPGSSCPRPGGAITVVADQPLRRCADRAANWTSATGCGGRMTALLEPVRSASSIGTVPLLDGISLRLDRGQILGWLAKAARASR
jgi:hypothetical protein